MATRKLSASIQGHATDIIIIGYEDRLMVTVTQIGTMGTLLHVKKDEVYGGSATFSVSILMGRRDEPLLVACARQLAERISDQGHSGNLFLSLGLRDHSAETMKCVLDQIMANPVW